MGAILPMCGYGLCKLARERIPISECSVDAFIYPCEKYPKGIPDEIFMGGKKCAFFEQEDYPFFKEC